LKVTRSEHDGIPVLKLDGDFDSFETEIVREGFEAIVAQGKHRVIFDLAGMSFANSTTIAYLITAQRRAGEMGGRLVLARPRDFLRKTLSTLGLDTVFPMTESLEAAAVTLKSP